MINDDHLCDDPLTVFRFLRRGACYLGITLGAVALALLISGDVADSIQVWNLGCTLVVSAAIAFGCTAVVYAVEPVMRGMRAIEVGEQAIAETVAGLGNDDDGGGDLSRRRRA